MGDGEQSVLSYGANLNTPFGDTADNFAAIVKYGDKMSVLEGTWTTPRSVIPSGPMVLCKEGVIMCTGGAENAPDVKAYDIFGNEVEMPKCEVSDDYKNMPWHYAAHVNEGKPIHDMLTFDTNVEIMAILDAAMKSSQSGKEEKISD
jgi:predicted dehydrogenase